jgi:hypothetical protein
MGAIQTGGRGGIFFRRVRRGARAKRPIVGRFERSRIADRVRHRRVSHCAGDGGSHVVAKRAILRQAHRELDVAIIGLRNGLREAEVHEDAVAHALGMASADSRNDGNAGVEGGARRIAAGVGHRVEGDVDQGVARPVIGFVAAPIGYEGKAGGGDAKTRQSLLDRTPILVALRREREHGTGDGLEHSAPHTDAALRELQHADESAEDDRIVRQT